VIYVTPIERMNVRGSWVTGAWLRSDSAAELEAFADRYLGKRTWGSDQMLVTAPQRMAAIAAGAKEKDQ